MAVTEAGTLSATEISRFAPLVHRSARAEPALTPGHAVSFSSGSVHGSVPWISSVSRAWSMLSIVPAEVV